MRKKIFRTNGTTYAGAPPGIKFYLSQEPLSVDGYASSGRYYGRGDPLYRFESASRVNGDWISGEFRAKNRRQAKAIMRKLFDDPKFFS